MQEESFTILPAPPGYRVLCEDRATDALVVVGEPVLAWRVETRQREPGEAPASRFSSVLVPVTLNGDPPPHWIGLENPDGSVSIAGQARFASLGEYVGELRARMKQEAAARAARSGGPS